MQGQVNPPVVFHHLIEHSQRTNALVQDVALLKVPMIYHSVMCFAEMGMVVVTTSASPERRKESFLFLCREFQLQSLPDINSTLRS